MSSLFRATISLLVASAAGCGSSSPAPTLGMDAAPGADAAADIVVDPEVMTTAPDAASAPEVPAASCGASGGGSAWAGWPMIEPRQRSYDTSAPGVVLDRTTNLMWQRRDTPVELGWNEANAYCDCLEVGGGGYSDWRLPTRIELLSIVDYTRQDPSIDPEIFPATPVTWFWSASTVAGNPIAAWYLSFMDGNTHDAAKDVPYGVRCVRQAGLPRKPYEIAANGTVVDPGTRLTWQRASDAILRSWDDASAYCAQLKLAGGGWRLPSMYELQTLIDDGATEPAIDQAAFPDTPGEGFWAGTPLADQPPFYWFVAFDRGVAYNAVAMHEYHVRCVR